MKVFDWKELVTHARQHSPYYRELYSKLGSISTLGKLSDVPIVNQAEFWKANTAENNQVFTSDRTDGIAFKSGGTTDNPKFSIYSRDEWNLFTRYFGEAMNHAGLTASDKVANLFYVGEMYASFIFIMKCIESAPIGALQFPISGSTNPDIVLKTLQEFRINLLAGLPTTLMNVVEKYAQNPSVYPDIRIDKILFGGESMYKDQRLRLEEVFPGIIIRSIGYASVDAGLIGYSDDECGPDEHRVFGEATIFEIVDEDSFEPIVEQDRPGKILLTNLIRSYMPIIRYPVGDRAVWLEPDSPGNPNRKYQILGRSEEAARVGPVSVYYEDMRAVLASLDVKYAFQLLISHYELKDALTLRLSTPGRPFNSKQIEDAISEKFGEERRMFAEAAADNKIHPLRFEWVAQSALEINARTGKLRRVIDKRQ